MIKTFDTIKEAKKRFEELQYAVSESCGESVHKVIDKVKVVEVKNENPL